MCAHNKSIDSGEFTFKFFIILWLCGEIGFFCGFPHRKFCDAGLSLGPGQALRQQNFPRREKSAKNFILKKFRLRDEKSYFPAGYPATYVQVSPAGLSLQRKFANLAEIRECCGFSGTH
ncbi:hypothetical protein [Clostridium sp. MSTE9]|uniref:hypothetical protein n=1 Tax=Clostridium sp. (strain MSTE9) TaxID=1105031 RepID=UPI0012DEE84E|nr:hypothetical protein [Clostridium sp. MSTE9]